MTEELKIAEFPFVREAETRTLTHADIRDLLTGLAAAIELDQIRVDALPAERFHPRYDDSMWRRWRHDHLALIERLLPTVRLIPTAMLRELTGIAVMHEPASIQEALIDLFCEVTTACALEDDKSAGMFFRWLIKATNQRTAQGWPAGDARGRMMRWVRVTDPLRIADDPECGYGVPFGSIN